MLALLRKTLSASLVHCLGSYFFVVCFILPPGTVRAMAPSLPPSTQVSVSVFPHSAKPGDRIHLQGSGLPPARQVEAGLRSANGRRESTGFYWTDSEGELKITISLPRTAVSGETWLGIIKINAGETFVYLSSTTVIASPGPFTYRVKKGDTLGVIAGWFYTTIDDILRLNPGVTRSSRLSVGQRLVIPIGSKLEQPAWLSAGYRIPDYDGSDWRGSVVKGSLGAVWEEIQADARWIDVDLTLQTARAYQGERLVRRFIVSTGRGRTPTVTGIYHIYVKHRYVDMSGPGYYLENVPHTMYFYQGYGLHGTYWHNNFGRPMSHGCVNLSLEDAEWLYEFASVGTMVHVHE